MKYTYRMSNSYLDLIFFIVLAPGIFKNPLLGFVCSARHDGNTLSAALSLSLNVSAEHGNDNTPALGPVNCSPVPSIKISKYHSSDVPPQTYYSTHLQSVHSASREPQLFYHRLVEMSYPLRIGLWGAQWSSIVVGSHLVIDQASTIALCAPPTSAAILALLSTGAFQSRKSTRISIGMSAIILVTSLGHVYQQLLVFKLWLGYLQIDIYQEQRLHWIDMQKYGNSSVTSVIERKCQWIGPNPDLNPKYCRKHSFNSPSYSAWGLPQGLPQYRLIELVRTMSRWISILMQIM